MQPPAGTRHFDMSSPGGGGGKGGSYPYPREHRIEARSCGDHRKLDAATISDRSQLWKALSLLHT